MPCIDSRDSVNDERQDERLQAATRAACDLANAFRKTINPTTWNAWQGLSPETVAWIADHDAEDLRQVAREREKVDAVRKRRAALDKLTPDERRLLGVG